MSADGTRPVGGPAGSDLLSALREGRVQGDEARLKAATQLLEGTFYQELFKVMRETVPEDGAVAAGAGQDVFEGLLDQHVADAAARRSQRGLGAALYRYFAARVW